MDIKTNDTEVNVKEEGESNVTDVSSSDPAGLFWSDTTKGQHYSEIDHNIQEVDLPNGRGLDSMDSERNCRNDTAKRNDSEINKIKIKEEVDVSTDLPNEGVTDFGNTFRRDSVSELDSNTELNERDFYLDIGIKKEEKCFTSDLVIKKEFNMNDNGEVIVERMATEIGTQAEESISDFSWQNKNRVKMEESSESAESSGLSIDATPGGQTVETSQMSQNMNSPRSRKFESGKSGSSLQRNSSRRLLNLRSGDKRVHKCEICHNSFTWPSDLKAHILIHYDKKPYACTVCKKVFNQLSNLKLHTMRHEGKKPHRCDVCKRGFILLTDLKRHEMIHWNKPYKCNVCKESFMVLSDFRLHIRLHEGKKLLECEICKKSFSWPSHLKVHILTHNAKKLHECTVCKETFIQLSSLRVHNLIHERQKQEELWSPINC